MSSDAGAGHIPRFYGCYMLRSILKKGSFYLGSTPDPVRRLRQHNGLLSKGGAYRTKREGTRPWKMVLLVFGFPSKVSALQFEHAWQHPYQTRFIEQDKRIVKTKGGGRSVHHKLGVLKLLLTHPYFKVMCLKVQIFSEDIYGAWKQDKWKLGSDGIQVVYEEAREGNEDSDIDDEVINQAANNLKDIERFHKEYLRLDELELSQFRERLVHGDLPCYICKANINYVDDNEKELVTLCANQDCKFISCLKCLHKVFVDDEELITGIRPLIPSKGRCPCCKLEIMWAKAVKRSLQLRS